MNGDVRHARPWSGESVANDLWRPCRRVATLVIAVVCSTMAMAFGGSFTRQGTVPAGKALLISVLNTLFGAGAFDCEPTVPRVLCDLNALRQSAAATQDDPPTLRVELDGVPVRNIHDFRVQSPVMSLIYPSDNVIAPLFQADVPGGTYTPTVSDGYWPMLPPLASGQPLSHVKAVSADGFVGELTLQLAVVK